MSPDFEHLLETLELAAEQLEAFERLRGFNVHPNDERYRPVCSLLRGHLEEARDEAHSLALVFDDPFPMKHPAPILPHGAARRRAFTTEERS